MFVHDGVQNRVQKLRTQRYKLNSLQILNIDHQMKIIEINDML